MNRIGCKLCLATFQSVIIDNKQRNQQLGVFLGEHIKAKHPHEHAKFENDMKIAVALLSQYVFAETFAVIPDDNVSFQSAIDYSCDAIMKVMGYDESEDEMDTDADTEDTEVIEETEEMPIDPDIEPTSTETNESNRSEFVEHIDK